MSTGAPHDGAADALSVDAPPDPAIAPVSSGEPRCAEHPEREAYAICERCGDNLCAACRRNAGGAERCAACLAREGGESAVVPWEDQAGSFLRRVFGSLDGLVLRPSRVMARLPTGKRGSPYELLFVVVFVVGMVNAGLSGDVLTQGGAGGVAAGFACLGAWLGGLAATGVASLAGARASANDVRRAAVYAWSAHSVGALFGGVASFLTRIFSQTPELPLVAGWAAIGLLVTLVLMTRSMFAYARGRLRLGVVGSLGVASATAAPIWLAAIVIALYVWSVFARLAH